MTQEDAKKFYSKIKSGLENGRDPEVRSDGTVRFNRAGDRYVLSLLTSGGKIIVSHNPPIGNRRVDLQLKIENYAEVGLPVSMMWNLGPDGVLSRVLQNAESKEGEMQLWFFLTKLVSVISV